MRIKDLPQEIKELALVRQFEQYGKTDEKDLLIVGFSFAETPEGMKFWNRISKGKFDKFKAPKGITQNNEFVGSFIGNGIHFAKIKEIPVKDSIVEEVVENFKKRSAIGIKKYKTTLDRGDLSLEQWVQHAIEEAMDLTLYLQKIKRTLQEERKLNDSKK